MKTKAFLYISLAVDLSIAFAKFIAAAFTGSSSMVSEGVHSVIDAGSQVLLIWGTKVSRKPADDARPFGYGKELYFWSFMVSLIIFILGGCISVYEGLMRFRNPEFSRNPMWDYGILAIAFVFNGVSLASALKAFNKQRGDISFWEAVKLSKDPSTFIVLLGDVGDMLGLVVAFLGISLGRLLHNPYYDGAASIIIGLILIAISMLLVRESKSLLMGETVSKKTLKAIIALTQADDTVVKVKKYSSMYMAPEEILIQLDIVFKLNLTTQQITDAIERITQLIQQQYPKMKQVFIEPKAG